MRTYMHYNQPKLIFFLIANNQQVDGQLGFQVVLYIKISLQLIHAFNTTYLKLNTQTILISLPLGRDHRSKWQISLMCNK